MAKKQSNMEKLTEGLDGILPDDNKTREESPGQTSKEVKNISISLSSLEYEKLKTFYKMIGLNFSAGMKHAARRLVLTTTDEQTLRCYGSALEKKGIDAEDVYDQIDNLRSRR